MAFCSFCAKKSEHVKQIYETEVTIGDNVIRINNLLYIFQSDLVKFFLDEINALICIKCLKQLKKCNEFVQQMKNSEHKLNRGKEIKSEHDYFETERSDNASAKVTVDNNIRNTYANSDLIKSDLNFKPILPKTSSTQNSNKNMNKCLVKKTRLYKCLQCSESFKSYKNLIEHEKDFCETKFVKYLKVCNFCHKCYSNQNSLSAHISLKHSQGEFLCCMCEDKVFSAKGYLSRHIQKEHQHESLNYFCGECEEFACLSSQEELREHFLNKHPSEATTTMDDDDMDLEMHEEFLDEFLLAHTNENSFQFSECWEALDLHLPDMLQTNNMREFTKAFSCPKCYEQFKNPQPLLKHLADLHDLPVLMCRVCSKCFASFKDFKKHKLQKCLKNFTFHSVTLECPYCSKIFNNSLNLKQHLRIIHCQVKKHICQLCDKQFSTLDHLKKHVLSQHQNERKHVCSVCDKSFTQLGHLKQHLAIHTTGKTIQCSECSSRFWRKIDLERHHKKRHTSDAGSK